LDGTKSLKYTNFDDVNHLLEEIVQQIKVTIEDEYVGIYLYGSLVWGDFNCDKSDIDILVIIKNDLSTKDFSKLNKVHQLIVKHFPAFNNRLEIAYISITTIKNIKLKEGIVAIISPGEEFNLKPIGTDWVINSYLLQNKSITLAGPKPELIIGTITQNEFLENVKQQLFEWKDWISNTKDSVPYQGYALITICRAFYVLSNSEQASKIEAAIWVAQKYPKWKNLIDKAIKKNGEESIYNQVCDFLYEVIDVLHYK
jgi:predicted nucleotidyltransferase